MTPSIQKKLHTTIANSKVFRLMSAEEQMRLAAGLEEATDDQALQAIASLSKHDQIYNENEQKRLNAAKSQIDMAEKYISKSENLIR